MSFENFYKLTFKRVFRYFYLKVSNIHIAEDLTQDVYIEFYQKYGPMNLAQEDAIKLLYGFCNITYKSYIRKDSKNKETQTYDDNVSYESDYNEGILEGSIKEKLRLYLLMDLLEQLGINLRSVIICRFLNNMSREETSKYLNIKLSHVHVYQKRAIKKLRNLYLKAIQEN